MASNNQFKDFGWYNNLKSSSENNNIQHMATQPVTTTRIYQESKGSSVYNVQQKPYDRIVRSAHRSEQVQEPTIINIESKVYSPAPIKVLSVSHSEAYKSHQVRPRAHVYKNPIYEPRLSTNIDVPSTEHPSNTHTKSSIVEETEPLLDHGESKFDSLAENIGIVDDLGLSDTLGASDLKESTGFAENDNSQLGNVESSTNSLKLDSLNLDTDIESGAMFGNNVADLVDLDYKGDSAKSMESAYSEDIITDSEKWNYYYSRRSPAWIVELEEQERMERTARGQNPILLGKWHRVQLEFMQNRKTYFQSESVSDLTEELAEKISEKADEAVESFIETKEEVKHDIKESMHESFSGISGMLHSVADAAHGIVDSAKASMGYYPKGSYKDIAQLEEKERLSRMTKKVDPMLDAKKKHFERELIDHVKKAC